jgi:hypothetical protein
MSLTMLGNKIRQPCPINQYAPASTRQKPCGKSKPPICHNHGVAATVRFHAGEDLGNHTPANPASLPLQSTGTVPFPLSQKKINMPPSRPGGSRHTISLGTQKVRGIRLELFFTHRFHFAEHLGTFTSPLPLLTQRPQPNSTTYP